MGDTDTVSSENKRMRPIRRENAARLLEALVDRGPMSRKDLAERTAISRTTVFEIVQDLLDKKLVTQTDEIRASVTRGRPTALITLNTQVALVLGVDLSRRSTRIVFVNAAHEVVAHGQQTLGESELAPQARSTHLFRLIRRVMSEHGLDASWIRVIGLGWSGIVDAQVPSEAIVALRDQLADHFSTHVHVSNNSRLAALAESTWGAARDAQDVLYLHWGNGIGSGLVVNGRLIHGAHGAAGELGHVSVDPKNGLPCYCGSRGCLEQYAGTDAVLAACAKEGLVMADGAQLIESALDGSPVVRAALTRAAQMIGYVVAGSVAQLDPELIVVGGELSVLDDLVVSPIDKCVRATATPNTQLKRRVVRGQMGGDAAARGAVALAIPHLVDDLVALL